MSDEAAESDEALGDELLDEEGDNLEEDEQEEFEEDLPLEPPAEESIEDVATAPRHVSVPDPGAIFAPTNADDQEEHMAQQPASQTQERTVEVTAKATVPASQAAAAFNRDAFRAATGTVATKQQEDCLSYLERLRNTADASSYQIHIIRVSPSQWDGYALGFRRVLERWGLGGFNELQRAVQELHGGGEYEMRIVTPTGATAHQMKFEIDLNQHPPKIPHGAQPATTLPVVSGRYPTPGAPSGFGTLFNSPEAQEAIEARNEHQKLTAEKSRIKAAQELKRAKREAQEEDETYEQKREAKMRAPAEEARQHVEAVRTEMRATIDGLKTLIEAKMDGKKDDKSVEVILKAMETNAAAQIEAMKANSSQQAETTKLMLTLITTILSSNTNKPNESIEMMKSVMELMGRQMAEGKNSESNELLKILAMKAVNQDSNQIKLLLDMMNKGKQDTLELLEITRGNGSNEQVLDPDGGFLSNLGNLALHGVRRLVESGSAGRLASVAARAFAVPPPMVAAGGPIMEVVPQPSMQVPAPQPVRQPQRQLPPPQQRPAPAPAAPAPSATMVTGRVNPVYFDAVLDEATGAILSGPQPQTETRTVEQQPMRVETSAPPAPAVAAPTVSESLREHVSEAMKIAIDDLDNDRASSDWVGYAVEKWGRFIQLVANAADDVQRMEIIFSACDQEVLGELAQRIQSDPAKRVKFAQDVRALLNEYAGLADVAG